MSSFITRYGDEIKGVHCANDTIGYGVIEALRAEGMDVPIVTYDGNPQAVDLVGQGRILATIFTNPHWGGGITAALAYYAEVLAYLDNVPTYDWRDFWGPTNGQIAYK